MGGFPMSDEWGVLLMCSETDAEVSADSPGKVLVHEEPSHECTDDGLTGDPGADLVCGLGAPFGEPGVITGRQVHAAPNGFSAAWGGSGRAAFGSGTVLFRRVVDGPMLPRKLTDSGGLISTIDHRIDSFVGVVAAGRRSVLDVRTYVPRR